MLGVIGIIGNSSVIIQNDDGCSVHYMKSDNKL